MQSDGQFELDPEKVYTSMDELTLDTEEGPRTLKMGVWINVDPVRIHRMIVRDKILQVDTLEVLNPLVSKLRRADPEYYKRFMGLRLVIDYPGYSAGILAKIPFENDPVRPCRILQVVAQGKARGQGLSLPRQQDTSLPESCHDGAPHDSQERSGNSQSIDS